MKPFTLILFLFFMSCLSQNKSEKMSLEFEDVYHHQFNLISEKFLIIDSQQEMNAIYQAIRKNYGGERSAPIPHVNESESYVIFKPLLKNSNDVIIKSVGLQSNTLEVEVQDFDNQQISKTIKNAPNILIKILKKLSTDKIDIKYSKQ